MVFSTRPGVLSSGCRLFFMSQPSNGTHEEIPIRAHIPDGGHTRAIDLPGDRRMIQSVDLWYSKGNWSRRPKVSLYGAR